MKTLVLANQKGGVGKSAIATQLAFYLASQGRRVLFLDLDHQQNSTRPIVKSGRAAVAAFTTSQLLLEQAGRLPDGDFVLVKADDVLSTLERQPDKHNALVPYNITEDERQFDDFSQVSENEQRMNLQPLDMAAFIAKKLVAGMSKKDVAAKLRIDPSTVTHLLALRDAPEFILELYHGRKCRSPKYLYTLLKLHEKNAEVVERCCAQAAEIDKALLLAIAAEIEAPKIAPAAVPTDVRSVLGSGGQVGADAGDGHPGSSTAPQAPAPAAQQMPLYNPAIEKQAASKSSDPSRLKKPLLLGTHKDRPLMLVLDKRPKAAGVVWVRYEDGSGDDEVSLAEIVLSLLTEAAA